MTRNIHTVYILRKLNCSEAESENGTIFRNCYKSKLNVTWNKTNKAAGERLGTANFAGSKENNVGLLYPKPAKPELN